MSSQGYTRVQEHESDDTEPPVLRQDGATKVRLWQILSVVLLATNVVSLGLLWKKSDHDCLRPQLVYVPARKAIRYEKRRLFRSIKNNVYTGDPRPEHDAAWEKLIEPITIKISGEELARINETSIAFADGSGYIAETSVYHELHCIKRVRRHLNLDYYYPNMTEHEKFLEGPHIDHCLEYWRESAMCRGDTSLSTFAWGDGRPFSHVWSDHECVNWNNLDAWARGRMVNLTEGYSMLVDP